MKSKKSGKPLDRYMNSPYGQAPNDRSGWNASSMKQKLEKKIKAVNFRNNDSSLILDQIEKIK